MPLPAPALPVNADALDVTDPDVRHESYDVDDEVADHIRLGPEMPDIATLFCECFGSLKAMSGLRPRAI